MRSNKLKGWQKKLKKLEAKQDRKRKKAITWENKERCWTDVVPAKFSRSTHKWKGLMK